MTDVEPIRRGTDGPAKSAVNFANEPARRSTTLLRTNRPQHQPTIFSMDIDPIPTKASNPTDEVPQGRNIVIFGDSGVGKSSLINMLSGQKTAETSNGVLGCTFQSRHHTATIEGEQVNLWDTAGLDEGTRGRVPQELAEKNLTKLLRDLRGASGIHLLVYCIRGPSVKKSLARNYVIFYSALCRKKVPIVAVVTGLEHEPVSMDEWWTKGEKEMAKYKMRFNDHACVTTIAMEKLAGTVLEERSQESRELVRKLIVNNCRRTATRPSSDTNIFIKAALLDFRSVMRSGWEGVQPLCSVVFCQSDVFLFQPGVFGDLKRINSQINGRSFVFHSAGNLSERYITPRVPKGGADLLIFAGTPSASNKERFRDFYTCCSGEVCPVLVVTKPGLVDEWNEYLDSLGIDAHVLPWDFGDGRSQADLRDQIDELCLVRGPARYRRSNLFRLFGRRKENVDEIHAS